MLLLLADDQGRIWRGDSRELRCAFDSPYSGGEFTEYAILNLGFVAINGFGSSFQIRLRPSRVAERACQALVAWLEKVACDRVVITSFDGTWTNQMVKPNGVDDCIRSLVSHAQRSRQDDFLVKSVGLEQLDAKQPIGQLARDWRELTGSMDQRQLLRVLKDALGDRFVVVRREPDRGRMLFQHIGEGLFQQYETWRNCAVGAPIEEQPDRQFGRFTSKTYNEVLASGAPRIDAVDAILRWPHAGRCRHRYKRVIVPLPVSGSASGLLVGGSIPDNSIDLRVGTR